MAQRKSERSSRRRGSENGPEIPDVIFAQASPRSIGGVSLFDAQSQINADTVTSFFSQDFVINQAVARLRDAGFEVLQATALTINIAGSAETYQRAFNTTIIAEERPVIKEMAEETTAAFLDSPDTALPGLIGTAGTMFEDILEGVAIEEPRYFMAGEPAFAPNRSYWYLDVPGDVSLAMNADRAHRASYTGKGIKVAMVDSGWYRHPFFVERGYRVSPVVLGPAAANPLDDENGHGTAESANIFAVAPDVELTPVKINFVNSIGAFNAAVGLRPDIITCSWGSSVANGPLSAANQALAAAIAAAVASGIIVIFSAGNGHFGFPGQHPDVISAGGVFMNQNGTFRASDYASGFMSSIYPNRRVPDVCGLVGMRPRAAYIMLPLRANCTIDQDLAGGTHPNADETAANDGWAAISGTSAAAPQLAGLAALMKQACPRLTPAEIRDIMRSTARDVTTGNCNPATGGHPAGPGPDLATGHGLADSHRAVMVARVRCLGPIGPVGPLPGVVAPPTVQPPGVINPPSITPPSITPPSIRPPLPTPPLPPVGPRPPSVGPIGPVGPGSEVQGGAMQAGYLSPEEVQALEDMITGSESDIDLGL